MTAAPLSTAFRSLVGLGGVFTSAKSFEDNPVLSSRWLNQAGLHVARVTWAHRVAASRRARLGASRLGRGSRRLRPRRLYPQARCRRPTFATLLAEVKSYRAAAREMIQGDTLDPQDRARRAGAGCDADAARLVESAVVAQPPRLCRRHDARVRCSSSRPSPPTSANAEPDPQTYFPRRHVSSRDEGVAVPQRHRRRHAAFHLRAGLAPPRRRRGSNGSGGRR